MTLDKGIIKIDGLAMQPPSDSENEKESNGAPLHHWGEGALGVVKNLKITTDSEASFELIYSAAGSALA